MRPAQPLPTWEKRRGANTALNFETPPLETTSMFILPHGRYPTLNSSLSLGVNILTLTVIGLVCLTAAPVPELNASYDVANSSRIPSFGEKRHTSYRLC